MKEITGKQKRKSSSLFKAIKTKQGITKKEIEIAKEFNKYFTSVGTALASKIPVVTKDLSEYLPQCNTSIEHKELTFQEFAKNSRFSNKTKPLFTMVLVIILLWKSMILERSFSLKI